MPDMVAYQVSDKESISFIALSKLIRYVIALSKLIRYVMI